MSHRPLRPFGAIALLLSACQAPPAVPSVTGTDPFAVGYRGEVVALAAAEPFPEPEATAATTDDARLVTVRTRFVELSTAVAQRLLPALSPAYEPPMPATNAAVAAAAPAEDGRLQPRRREPEPPSFLRVPAVTAARAGEALATVRGVHADPGELRAAVATLLAQGRARIVGEPEISCAEGAEGAVSLLDETALVHRVDLVPSGNAAFAYDLGVDMVRHGTWVQLAPRRGSDGALQLGIRVQVRELVRPVPVAATRFGSMHLPTVALQDLRALVPIQEHDALVLGTLSGSAPGLVVLPIVEVAASRTGRPGDPAVSR